MSSTRILRLKPTSAAPRAHLFTPRHYLSTTSLRPLPSSNSPSSFFNQGPAPPRLPKEEQELFEALQRSSTGAFSTPRSRPQINQSPDSTAEEVAQAESVIEARQEKMAGGDSTTTATQQQPLNQFSDSYQKIIEARGKGEELHPNVRRGATPEFEGEVNPKTGEVGGPKNEPLRWGGQGEWSYNGRTTDF